MWARQPLHCLVHGQALPRPLKVIITFFLKITLNKKEENIYFTHNSVKINIKLRLRESRVIIFNKKIVYLIYVKTKNNSNYKNNVKINLIYKYKKLKTLILFNYI